MKKHLMVIGTNDEDINRVVRLIEGDENLRCLNSMIYRSRTLQIPSSYLRGDMMKHIISAQQRANAVIILLSSDQFFKVYPPNFAKVFRIPSVGVLLTSRNVKEETLGKCYHELNEIKVDKIQVLDLENYTQCQQLLSQISLIEEGII